ncbi:MAG: hypothetical protein HYY11_06835 [Candidatus Methylomirabilis oxyfera]|nr:hypothetical protein [Candidatus Methylomirabilis oxyfera]
MHDVDRTQGEYEPETDALEADSFEFEYTEEGGASGGVGAEGPFDEVEEMELAAQMLEITDEAELDQFLGDLIKKAGRAVGRFVKSPIGRTLGGILKGAAKKAIPILGGAAGGFFGGPVGAAIGSKMASGAGKLFGLELEGMSQEDQEFEVARRFVRFAGDAAKRAAVAPPTVDPQAAARSAVVAAARRHAPGLIRGNAVSPPPSVGVGVPGRRGRWIRRGRKVILLGV